MIQLSISDPQFFGTVVLFIISMFISVWTFTLTYRENEELKCYKPRGWRKRQTTIWAWQIALMIVLLVMTMLPLILIDSPNYI